MTWPRPDRDVRGGSLWFVASTGALRAPWRISVFLAAFAVAWTIAGAFVYPLLSAATAWMTSPPALYPWLMLIAATAAVTIALRKVDAQEWRDVALDRASWRTRTLAHGALIGGAAITIVAVLLLMSGSAVFTRVADLSGPEQWSATALRALMLLAPAALWEELVFRGYLWRVAEQAGGTRVALWTTSAAFGAVHMLNPGASARTLLIVMLAGVCLGVVREHTQSVPATWLAHFMWNFVMAAILHAPVSGLQFEAPGWRLELTGASWWTGGAWGPEGGAASVLVLLCALVWYRQRVRAEEKTTLARASATIDSRPVRVALREI